MGEIVADDRSLDLTGIGKLAQAVPAPAWSEVVHTACESFQKFLAPIIETTSGIGRLIQAKFDRLVEAEKVLAANLVAEATRKVRSSRKPQKRAGKERDIPATGLQTPTQVQATVVVAAIEQGAIQTDQTLRELWSNLLAQELATGGVHPEFPGILSRLSGREAQILAEVAQGSGDETRRKKAFIRSVSVSIMGVGVSLRNSSPSDPHSFEHEHLRLLNLIENRGGLWFLTLIGEEFIGAVSDPSLV